MSIRSSLLAVAAVCLMQAASAIQYSTELPVKLGEWNWNFEEAKQIADSQHIPMVLFWGGASCHICQAVEAALDEEVVTSWQAERKLVMVFQSGTGGEMKELVRNASGVYPYICVYWNRGDGVTTTNRFSGVVSGASHWPATGNTVGEHFVKSVELYIGDYQPEECYSGSFACGNAEGTQLQVVLDKTRTLYVPLARTTASSVMASENSLVATYPDGARARPSTNVVEWTAGERERLVPVAVPQETLLRAGDAITLTLYRSDGIFADEVEAKIVDEPANSPSNPDWLGEPFQFGRWTFDYAAATNAVAERRAAGQEAYTLVLFTGALWCPYCKGIENSLLAPGSEFYSWAAAHNVALVEFDQGRASSPATAAGTRAPRLLTYEPDPKLDEDETVSGSGYLSRHEVLRLDAEAVLARTTHYTEAWLSPESTSARLSQPTMLLVKEDKVVGRFAAYRDASPSNATVRAYDIRENIGRLTDLLSLWNRDDERTDYRTTTDLRLTDDGAGSCGLQLSARSAYYGLEDMSARRLEIVRTDDGLLPAYFSLLRGTTVIASGTNALSVTVSGSGTETEGYSLRVFAYPHEDPRYLNDASRSTTNRWFLGDFTTSRFTVAFAADEVLVPEERGTSFVPRRSTVRVSVTEGIEYRFAGFSASALQSAFAHVGGGIWRALRTEEARLENGVTVGQEASYQIWQPGLVRFADAKEERVEETSGVHAYAVVRENGSSGELAVTVTNDVSRIAEGRLELGMLADDGTFVPGEPQLVWSDGEAGEKGYAVRVIDDIVHDGDQSAVLGLRVDAGGGRVSETDSSKVITVLEDDPEGAGRLAIVATDPAIVKGRQLYAAAGETVTFDVARQIAADGEVGATFTVTVGGVETNGCLSPESLVWPDRCRGEIVRQRVSLALPQDAVGKTVTVRVRATGDAKTDPESRTLSVSVIAGDAPQFAAVSADWEGLSKVALSQSIGVTGTAGGRVTVRKVTGSLPGGLVAKYDATNGKLVFSGTPNRAGAYSATYQVEELREGVTVRGGTFTARFTITALADAFPVFGEKATATRTYKDVYFVEDESRRVTGVLTLTVPTSGRLSARYRCSVGSLSFTCTGWSWWDAEAGTLTAYLTNRKEAYDGYYAELTQYANGDVVVQVHDARFPAVFLKRTLTERDLRSASRPSDSWRGVYTLAMPPLAYQAMSDNDKAYAAAAAGCPCFSLKMSSRSAINAGRFTWAGWLPNGKRISGSAVLAEDGKDATLPIFARNSAELFAGLVSVKGGVADEYEQTGGGEFKFGLRAITAAGGAYNWWEHKESRATGLNFGWTYDAYGSYYDDDEDLGECLRVSGVSTDVDFYSDVTNMPASEVYGRVTDELCIPVTVGASDLKSASEDLKITLSRSTGILSGSVEVSFEDGTVRVPWRGVVLPGWTGCGCHDEEIDLPFFYGAAWFADRVKYVDMVTGDSRNVSVRRGFAVSGETHIVF